MRINKFIAQATGMSRRNADSLIKSEKINLNGKAAVLGDEVQPGDTVMFDGQKLEINKSFTTIMLNKPAGYVCSRQGQGSKTIYELLPEKYGRLKPVGRLDKDSSGLILLSDDGQLANKLTHPRYQKEKIYHVKLNKTLSPKDKKQLLTGVSLSDGTSKFLRLNDCSDGTYEIEIAEGRNRQIRRTFNTLGYKTTLLHRVNFGPYSLRNLKTGEHTALS